MNPTTLSLVGTVYITFIPFTWQWHDNILVQQGLLDIVPNSNIKEWRYPYLGLGIYAIWLTCWFEWTGKEWHCTKWICLESSNMSSHFGSAKDVFLAWFARISSFTASHNTGSGRRSLGCKERCGAVNGQGWIFPLKKWKISPILPFYPSDSTKMQNCEIFEATKEFIIRLHSSPCRRPWHCTGFCFACVAEALRSSHPLGSLSRLATTHFQKNFFQGFVGLKQSRLQSASINAWSNMKWKCNGNTGITKCYT